MKMKCVAYIHDREGNLYKCDNKAKFKIADIVCEWGRDSEFWVCEDCVKIFIGLANSDDPHYIIVEELR